MSATATKRKGAKKPTIPSPLLVHPALTIDDTLKDWASDYSLHHAPKWLTQEHLTTRTQHAMQLSAMTDGMVKVLYCPGQFFESEREASRGHLFDVWIDPKEDTSLDDRKDEPLAEQLAEILEDYSAKLITVANNLRSLCKAKGGAA